MVRIVNDGSANAQRGSAWCGVAAVTADVAITVDRSKQTARMGSNETKISHRSDRRKWQPVESH